MKNKRRFSIMLSSLLLLILVGFGLYKWIRFNMLDINTIFFIAIAIAYLFNSLNWGDMQGGDNEDELDKHISTQSAKISYFIVLIIAGITLFTTDFAVNFNDIENMPLLFVFCSSLIVLPITEYFFSKKFK
ncbi:DUF2178 domain-containing protein [Gracilibacillus thailandensis]|uniref:DUF2178 domain-containing protein n=1 Tax=Gracilibacillus thailandensis TaxID=563735 RepID=A0A6N7R2X3_9BACI|nr:DUF2178 domain-containing protein [Gracilibacillus thailandensis]MRI65916.1 DUF2178 domain-containing protein [Gracilibacillus thailandensis]